MAACWQELTPYTPNLNTPHLVYQQTLSEFQPWCNSSAAAQQLASGLAEGGPDKVCLYQDSSNANLHNSAAGSRLNLIATCILTSSSIRQIIHIQEDNYSLNQL